MTKNLVKQADREDQLQFLRFLAFLNVFITHAERWLFFEYPSSHCGISAVSFFFMLSGVVTGYSFFGKNVTLGFKEELSFLWKRLRKIYPLYLITTLFTVLISGIPVKIISGDYAGAVPDLTQLLKNLLLLQSWFPENAHSFNSVGWYLSTLMFLYAFSIPFAFLLDRIFKTVKPYLITALLFAAIFLSVVVYCYLTQGDAMTYLHFEFPPARLGEYLMGMIIGFTAHSIKNRFHSGSGIQILFTVLEISALIYWFVSLDHPGNYWRNHTVSWLIPNAFVLSVFILGQGWCSRLFRWKPLVSLGNVSFECYLVHQIIVTRYYSNIWGYSPTQAGNIFSFFFCLLFSLMIAYFIHSAKSVPRTMEKVQ